MRPRGPVPVRTARSLRSLFQQCTTNRSTEIAYRELFRYEHVEVHHEEVRGEQHDALCVGEGQWHCGLPIGCKRTGGEIVHVPESTGPTLVKVPSAKNVMVKLVVTKPMNHGPRRALKMV